jgi:hypothetical protein
MGTSVKINAAAGTFDLVPPPPPSGKSATTPPPPLHVTTTSATVILKDTSKTATSPATFADLKDKAPVAVAGKLSADKTTIAAVRIDLLPPPPAK